MFCDVCSDWVGPAEGQANGGHHARCPLGPALAPSEGGGACHCGHTVLSTDYEPCPFCGGFTRQQLDAYTVNGEDEEES